MRRIVPFFGAEQGFFVSVGGGMATTLTSGSGLLLDPGATAMLSIGYHFTSVSSLRLSGLMRYLKTDELYNKSSFGLQLDYLFKLHALGG